MALSHFAAKHFAARHFLTLFAGVAISAAPSAAPRGFGGGGGGGYDRDEEYFNSFEYWDNKQRAFDRSVLAWELGYDSYTANKGVSFEEFAARAFDSSYDAPTPMKTALLAIDSSLEIKRIELRMNAAKVGVATGAGYAILKLVFLL